MRFLRTSTFPFRVFFDKSKALSMVRVRLSRCRCGNVAKITWVAHQIDIPSVNTTNYGLHSFRYHANKLCNLLPGNVRVSASLAAFIIALKIVQVNDKCCSFCDQC